MSDNTINLVSDFETDTYYAAGIRVSPNSHRTPIAPSRIVQGNSHDKGAYLFDSFEDLLSDNNNEGICVEVLMPFPILTKGEIQAI